MLDLNPDLAAQISGYVALAKVAASLADNASLSVDYRLDCAGRLDSILESVRRAAEDDYEEDDDDLKQNGG
jgi:hypothetical protein